VWILPSKFRDHLTEPLTYRLFAPEDLPHEMEAVPEGAGPIVLPGLDHLKPERTAPFLMDRHPVTNREFKVFVDAGGYERAEYWVRPFRTADEELSREDAMARFVDAVGRPGPAAWEMGRYPGGDDDLPVTGVSWYEADAYARWCDKELPTLFHWNRVAFTAASSQIIPTANLAGRKLLPVGSTPSLNRFGVCDLAGNVREWSWNACNREGEHFILGGGWNDPEYAFTDAYAQSAFDRSETNGFRCIRKVEPEPNREALGRDINLPFRDFRAESPVSDEVFEFFLRQFHYDKDPLEATIDDEREDELGVRQLVSFNAAYGGQRMAAYLYRPLSGSPPYQTVVMFPGSLAIHTRTVTDDQFSRVDFITKSGRALLLPVLKGTYQRGGDLKSDYPEETSAYKDYVVMWAKDLARSVDYLESRDDIDAERIAYFGLSWGGAQGSIMPAVEKRFRANVLYVAGLNFQRALPEVDQINYVTRVTQPTLMLNGERDFFFPVETSQKAMFELLGTPPEHKKRLTYPRGHTVPRRELVKETLAWLDRYLGPT
jgi:dienelactone hydrolase